VTSPFPFVPAYEKETSWPSFALNSHDSFSVHYHHLKTTETSVSSYSRLVVVVGRGCVATSGLRTIPLYNSRLQANKEL
jgi:hypothetical protein